MADPEISETQFVFGYLRELFERRKAIYSTAPSGAYFTLPTTVKEKDLPADFFVKYYSHSEYYQFKRSHSLKGRRGTAEIAAGIPVAFLPYYRFQIYNKKTVTKLGTVKLGQYEKLVDIAYKNPGDLVFYCAPCFHTEDEFFDLFNMNQIVDNSALINCRHFSGASFKPPKFDINDGEKHFLVFKNSPSYGYICSEAQEIRVESAPLSVDVLRPVDFFDYVNGLNRELFSEGIVRDFVPIDPQNLLSANLVIVQELQAHLLTAYDIFWIPLFRV